MKLIPIGSKTIVKVIKNEEKVTSFGIILPSTAQDEESDIATVYASDKYPAGTQVLMPMYGYAKIDFEKETYYCMPTSDVLGIIKGA